MQEFKDEKFRGRFLIVTVARENFLDKLKREREEAAQKADPSQRVEEHSVPKVSLPTIVSKSKSDGSSSESSSSEESEEEEVIPKPVWKRPASKPIEKSESEEDEDNLVLRKKSKSYLENGRV